MLEQQHLAQLQHSQQLIIAAGQRLYQQGLIAGTDGNISLRLGAQVLITASGKSKGWLQAEDLVLLNAAGKLLHAAPGKLPSSEYQLHLAILRSRADCQAIVHAHPPFATALSMVKADLSAFVPAEVELQVGAISRVPYLPAGSGELATAVAQSLLQQQAVLLERHGVVTCGADLEQALCRMEAVEQAAKMTTIAALLSRC